MIKNFRATYITTRGEEKSKFFQADIPDNQKLNAISIAGRAFIRENINNPDFKHLAPGKHAIVEVND